MTIQERIIEQLSKSNLTIIQLCERISDIDRTIISTTLVRMKKNKLIKKYDMDGRFTIWELETNNVYNDKLVNILRGMLKLLMELFQEAKEKDVNFKITYRDFLKTNQEELRAVVYQVSKMGGNNGE